MPLKITVNAKNIVIDIVIFEDDINFSEYIKDVIAKSLIDYHIALITCDLDALCRYIELLEKPTIFILDIMFGEQSLGFKMADVISKSQLNAINVFITDYPEKILINSHYKIKAFNLILKSSNKFEYELVYTLKEAVNYISNNNILIYSDKFTTISIKIEGIYYIETVKNKNKVCIHHHNGIYEIRTSLRRLLKQLPDYFLRCHNSYIVNVNEIIKIHYSTCSITTKNGDICYYSLVNKNKLLNAFSSGKVEK